MHRRTLDIHQEEANILKLFLAPLDDPRFADLPEYTSGQQRLDEFDKSTLYNALRLRVKPDEK
jgi:hypothetical protein